MKSCVQENKSMDLGQFFLGFIKNIHNPEPFIKKSIDEFIKNSDFEFLKEINNKIDLLNDTYKDIMNTDSTFEKELKSENSINNNQEAEIKLIITEIEKENSINNTQEAEIQSIMTDVEKQKEINLKQDLEIDALKNTHIIESYFITDPKNIKQSIGVNDSSIRIGTNMVKDWDGNDNSKYKNLKGNISLGNNTSSSLVASEKIPNLNTKKNIAIGNGTLAFNEIGNYNTMCGHNCAIYSESGSANTGVGYTALMDNKTGSYNTAVGSSAGTFNNGSYNSFLGRWAGRARDGKTILNYNNTTCVGAGTVATNSKQVILGTENDNVYSFQPIHITSSDESFQKNSVDCKLGLGFIKKLHTIEFELVNNSSEKDPRKHIGLRAKDVKKTLDDLGMDYALYQDHEITGGSKRETISYQELVVPLIKSLQELDDIINEEIKEIKDEIAVLQKNTTGVNGAVTWVITEPAKANLQLLQADSKITEVVPEGDPTAKKAELEDPTAKKTELVELAQPKFDWQKAEEEKATKK
jgi:hypothetical protein